MFPPGSDPDGVFARGDFPLARLPHIGVSVPAMIASHPDVTRAWPLRTVFHLHGRRLEFNHDVGR
jgi:hypothetical protein